MNILVTQVAELYEAYRYLDAYDLTRAYWADERLPSDLDIEGLVLAGRLAERLGSTRLCRALLAQAQARAPASPHVRLYARERLQRTYGMLSALRRFESMPCLPHADPVTDFRWRVHHALTLAVLRDSSGARARLAEAAELDTEPIALEYAYGELAFMEDDWDGAQRRSDAVYEAQPAMPQNVHLRSRLAVRQCWLPRFVRELEDARGPVQCFGAASLHVYSLGSMAARAYGKERERLLERAWARAQELVSFVPLADKRCHRQIAALRLDLATLRGEPESMLHQARQLRSPYHHRLAENLVRNPGKGVIQVPHTPVWQAESTCLPCSIATLRPEVDLHRLIAELTYGGTRLSRSLGWLKRQAGLDSIPFVAEVDTVRALLRAGVGFIYLTGGDNWAHAMAAVALDEAADALVIHDPSSARPVRVLMSDLKQHQGPFGPQCVVLVPAEQQASIEALIPASQREPFAQYLAFLDDVAQQGERSGANRVAALWQSFPGHPYAQRVAAHHLMRSSRIGEAIDRLEALLRAYPKNLHVRMDLLEALHRCGNSRRLVEVYRELLDQGSLRQLPAVANTRNPVFIARYADGLGMTADGAARARTWLCLGLRNASHEAELWHALGDLCRREGALEAACLPTRVAACLNPQNDHYARSVLDLYVRCDRLEEGLTFLSERAHRAGTAEGAGAAWVTWVQGLADCGFPQRAAEALQCGLKHLPGDGELLPFAVDFWISNGEPDRAQALLPAVGELPQPRVARLTEANVAQRTGDWQKALALIETQFELDRDQVSLAAQYLYLLGCREGEEAALERARDWVVTHPEHEGFEELLAHQLHVQLLQDEREDLLTRRLERNPKDLWAWLELGESLLTTAEAKQGTEREAVLARVDEICRTVRELTLPDERPLLLFGRCAQCRYDTPGAEAHYQEAVALDVSAVEPIRQLVRILMNQPLPVRMPKLESLTRSLYERGSSSEGIVNLFFAWAETAGKSEALSRLQAWRSQRPKDQVLARTEGHLLLQYSEGRLDVEAAKSLLEASVEQFPGVIAFQAMLADVWRRLDDESRMREGYASLLKRFPLHEATRQNLAMLQVKEGDLVGAVELLREGVRLQPQEREGWRMLASLLEDIQDLDGAIDALEGALKLMPRDIGLNEYYIRLLLQAGREQEGLAHARHLTQRFEDGAYLWYLLGMTLEQTALGHSVTEVEHAYRTALHFNPGHFDSADQLACILTRNGRLDEARQVLDEFPDAEENIAPIEGRRAWILHGEGKTAEAMDQLHQVLELHPDYHWGWMMVMDWLEDGTDLGSAREALGGMPEVMRHNIDWRVRRVQVLENCGETDVAMSEEWAHLIQDFSEQPRVMLTYVDRCLERKKIRKARQTLEQYAQVDPGAPYVNARFVQILAAERRRSAAFDLALTIWARPGTDVEWPDMIAWEALVPDTYKTLPRGLRQRIRKHLKAGRHLRAKIFALAAELHAHLRSGEMLTLVGSHPERTLLLESILSAKVNADRADDAWRLWQGLDEADRNLPELWRCGLRALTATGKAVDQPELLDPLLADWRERKGTPMWAIGNYVMILEQRLPLELNRPQGWNEEETTLLEEIESTCRFALESLRFDSTARYMVEMLARSLLCRGQTEAFAEVDRQYHHLLDDPDEESWFSSERDAFLSRIPVLRDIVGRRPIDLQPLVNLVHQSRSDPASPTCVFQGLALALAKRKDVIHRDAQPVPPAADPEAGHPTKTKDARFPWWALILLVMAMGQFLRACGGQ